MAVHHGTHEKSDNVLFLGKLLVEFAHLMGVIRAPAVGILRQAICLEPLFQRLDQAPLKTFLNAIFLRRLGFHGMWLARLLLHVRRMHLTVGYNWGLQYKPNPYSPLSI